jgi:beta-glucosidase
VNAGANQIVAKLADGQMIEYLDIGPKFLGEGNTLSKEVMPDLLHLSPSAYKTWAQSIESHVARMMGEGK